MLKSPLGLLRVYKNGNPLEYKLKLLPLKPIEICSYKVDKRYLIEIDKSIISKGDIITFCVDTEIKAEVDGGDCLVEAMFETDDLFLAIGGYDINNGDKSNNFAYYFSVIENGLKVEFIDLQYLDELLVAIAWSSCENDDYYTSVWFAADPCI